MNNSSIFQSSGDPWENGWASDQTQQPSSSTSHPISSPLPVYGMGSTYMTSSQLLNHTAETNLNTDEEENSINVSNVPESYMKIHAAVADRLNTVNELESLIFTPLARLDLVSNYQKLKILDIIYDHNLLPLTITNNLYQVLGLIALEIDVPGNGDYITLQFRLKNLPELPRNFVSAVLDQDKTQEFIDPLNARFAQSSLQEDDLDNPSPKLTDPLLTDHSSVGLIDENDRNISNTSQHQDATISEISKHVAEIRDQFKPLVNANDQIKIKEVPEKEGLLFKHINYIITHDLNLGMNGPAGTKKVIRRYSDFVWLLEFLLQKYPFRVIPGLPPKKFSVGSSPDSQFLQRRRRGLNRFLNQLIKHPVLRAEPVVVTFLTVPTDISTWRKQAKIDYSIEFKGEKISTNFINLIWPKVGEDFLKNWKEAEQSITKLIEIWTKTVMLVERYEKRQQQISYDNGKFVEMINGFKTLNTKLYPNENETLLSENSHKDDINLLNDSLGYIGEFFNKSSQTLIDDSYTVNTIILEKFKNFLDYLYSLQELFERTKKQSINNIDQLEKRIKENEIRYNKLSTEDADVKGADLAKLRQIIINDKQEIFQQLNRDWLIKNCCFEEFLMFQETQYLIGELWIDWSKARLKFQEKMFSLSENLSNEIVNDMPLNR